MYELVVTMNCFNFLFNDAKADDEVLQGRRISELEMMWKEVLLTKFKIQAQNMPVSTSVRIACLQPQL